MQFIKKIKEKDIDVAILIVLMILVPIFVVPLSSGDELWNFAFVYKMNSGYLPYSDLNIIITPIFHMIGLIILKVFGANFLSFRIYNLIIVFTILFLIFKILKSLKIDKKNNIITIILAVILFGEIFSDGANYNLLAYIPILISLLILVNNKNNYYMQGFLILTTILIKQNIGVYFGIGVIIYILINRKNAIKNLFKISVVNIIGIFGFLLILYKKGILYDFYFYAISGIGEFSTNNINISYTFLLIIVIVVVNIILLHFLKKSKIIEKERNNRKYKKSILYWNAITISCLSYI